MTQHQTHRWARCNGTDGRLQVIAGVIVMLVIVCAVAVTPSEATGNMPATDSPDPAIPMAVRHDSYGLAVCGGLSESATWDLSSSPVHITCDVTVPLNISLTIEAGVIVQIEHPADDLIVAGTLNVLGSEELPITFQPAGEPVAGSWGQVRIEPGAVALLDHAVLEYGGYEGGMLAVYEGGLELRDSVIRYSASSGVVIANTAPLVPLIHGTHFEGNAAACRWWGSAYASKGGGIRIDSGSPTIEDSVFENNNAALHAPCTSASAYGGAISSENSAPIIRRCEFRNNWAKAEGSEAGASGGAIYQGYTSDTIVWEDNTFEGNWVSGLYSATGNAVYAGGYGQKLLHRNSFLENAIPSEFADPNVYTSGALYVTGWYTNEIEDSTFRNNTAWQCGALYPGYGGVIRNNVFDGNTSEGSGGAVCAAPTSLVERNTFSNNTARGGDYYLPLGGGLYCEDCASVRDNIFFGNQNLRGRGGALSVVGAPLVENNTFEENGADYGGALYIGAGESIAQNNLFVNNSAENEGGAIYVGAAETTIRNNTFHGNFGWKGGGIFLDSSASVFNNILVNNSYGAITTVNSQQEIDYNDRWNNGIAAWEAPAGPHDIAANPLFVDPAVGDFHLGLGSPCIDSADPDHHAPTDFEGDERPQGAGPDMGADEAPAGTGPAVAPLLTITGQGDDLVLSWSTAPRNAAYELWRAQDPFFTPGDPGADLVGNGSGPTCTAAGEQITCVDEAVLGDPAVHHFYVVRAFTAAGVWADSNRVGEFEFGLASATTRLDRYRSG